MEYTYSAPAPVIEIIGPELDMCEPYYKEIAESITQDEIDLVAKITWLEAGNQSMTGKKAVVEVILNRVMSNQFPDTINDVIYQSGQFSTASNVSVSKPTEEEYEAVSQVLNESETILNKDVMFFSTTGFKNRKTYERIGDHVFCY